MPDDYTNLLILAETLDDVEDVRVALENRIRAAAQGNIGLDSTIMDLLASVHKNESVLTRELQRAMERHPLGDWVKQAKGVGLKQAARLLAATGDPAWHGRENRPRRGPGEFRAYCGYDVRDGRAPRHQRGQQSNWNGTARMRARLIAESCIKHSGPYRSVYDAGRVKYADAVHSEPCAQCGPAGKPAPVGSPLSLGHQHARALRLVAREVLKDLFLEARRLRETECQTT